MVYHQQHVRNTKFNDHASGHIVIFMFSYSLCYKDWITYLTNIWQPQINAKLVWVYYIQWWLKMTMLYPRIMIENSAHAHKYNSSTIPVLPPTVSAGKWGDKKRLSSAAHVWCTRFIATQHSCIAY